MATSKCDNKETVEAYTGRTDQRGKDATSAGPTKQNHAKVSAPPHQPTPTNKGWRKISKIMLPAYSSSVFHTKFTKSE